MINMLHITARPRSAALRPFIASFHYNESDLAQAVERILPNGQAHLMINLDEDEFRTYGGAGCGALQRSRGAVLAGPHGRATAIDTREQRRLVAVEFRPGGAAAFLQMPLSEACDQIVDIDEFWGGQGRVLRERLLDARAPSRMFGLLESVLLDRFAVPPDRAMLAAARMLERGLTLADTRTRLGLLPKTFVRRFREHTGLTPKRYARVRRLQAVVGSVCRRGEVDWSGIAADFGYADQAHLIHDFRDLTGLTPTAYRPSSRQRRNHVPLSVA